MAAAKKASSGSKSGAAKKSSGSAKKSSSGAAKKSSRLVELVIAMMSSHQPADIDGARRQAIMALATW